MANAYVQCYQEVESYTKEQKSVLCRRCSLELFNYWQNKYGTETAKHLIWSTVCIIAVNDGRLRQSELELYNYCFGGNYPASYNEFCSEAMQLQKSANREYWEKCCKDIDDVDAYCDLVGVMLCVATIDGEIAPKEESLISSLCSAIEYIQRFY